MDIYKFIFIVLATWRIVSLLVNEDGPFDIFIKLRYIAGVRYDKESIPYGTNVISNGLLCTWCVSIWVAAIAAALLYENVPMYIVDWLAISSLVILFDEVVESIKRH